MPIADMEKRREYNRNYARQRRSGLTNSQTSNSIKGPVRIQTAKDVLELLEETINEVRSARVDKLTKARTLGYLASITLKAVETAGLEDRMEALEQTLGQKESK